MRERERKREDKIGGKRDRERRERGVERLYRRICADSREDSENLRKVKMEKFGDLGGISEECRKSFRRVLEEFR